MFYAECPVCRLWVVLSDEKNLTEMFSMEEVEDHINKVHNGQGLSRLAFVELKSQSELRPEEIYNPMRVN